MPLLNMATTPRRSPRLVSKRTCPDSGGRNGVTYYKESESMLWRSREKNV